MAASDDDSTKETLPSWLIEKEGDVVKGNKANITTAENTPLLQQSRSTEPADYSISNDDSGKYSDDDDDGGGVAQSRMLEPNAWHDQSMKQKKEAAAKKSRERESHPPGRLLSFFVLISTITIISSLCMVASQFLPLFFAENHRLTALQYALRLYMLVFCVVSALNELEYTSWIRNSALLKNFISRGFIYGFLGLIGMEESSSIRFKNMNDDGEFTDLLTNVASWFMVMSSWAMVIMGVVYFAMGACCLKGVRDRKRAQYKEMLEAAKEKTKVREAVLKEEGLWESR
eukprot:CAMPEP_0195509538 /NCGR_PEP_ID=MMETSP0794_2-20130614/2448_1 /TAXON_ID=515487 /ORGANISM="Stephanopyxis turris, Strain CCMP 815" /LENGTH=286 /DNA_ID=CAMNT_0040636783 /DNA_START=24 /DNA_END=884 /DNA_ORIENTATION=+